MTHKNRVRSKRKVETVNLLFCILAILMVLSITIYNHMFPYIALWNSTQSEQLIAYSVKTGDTVWNIAAKTVRSQEDVRIQLKRIQLKNELDLSKPLIPGQTIFIPVAVTTADHFFLTQRLP